jgi:LuxR family maltose regulon positive regulatory protein
LVLRARLFEQLEDGVKGPITLVSGAAGSGKTVLVVSWIESASLPGPAVWVSVERDELDATRFWGAVIDGLRASGVTAGTVTLDALTPPPSGAGKQFVRRLAEGLGELTTPVLLILDDLHELKAHEALDGLAALLRRAPAQLRVILLTRGAPRLGLHRLRVSGELTEIGGVDLEFTTEEASELLSAAGIKLAEQSLVRLRERTEGWAAGLRLAAMSLAGRPDPDRWIAGFTGSERTVADYLIGEVLGSQPPEVRYLLLRTSVLERVNGPLANLLAGQPDGGRLLQELEHANAFVTAVDMGRSWFRYHHLLSDLLRSQLQHEAPEEVEGLHRTAANWYAQNGFPVEAIRHAEAGKDWSYARDVLMEHWFTLFLDGQRATLHELLTRLPGEMVRSDAELAALFAADCLADGRLEDADAHLALAERLAESVQEPHRRRLDVTLAVVKLTRARSRGDFEATVDAAQPILTPAAGETWADIVSNEDLRALALMSLGYVEFWALRLEDAEVHLREGLALARAVERPYVALGCLGALAHIANMTPRPDVGEARSREAIELASRLGWSEDPAVGVAYLALGGGLVTRGRLEEGERWLDLAEHVLQGLPDPEASVSLPHTYGVLRFAQGRHEQASERFRTAVERPPGGLQAPHFLALSARAWQLRALIRLGDTGPARSALTEAGTAARTLVDWCNLAACLHLAEDDPQAAVEALAPVLAGSVTAWHITLQVEALVLEAVARDRLGEAAAAEHALERALDIAEPERQVWTIFTVRGARELLERHPRHRTAHGSVIAELLDYHSGIATARRAGAAVELREPLTERELAVLRFLPTNLSAAEIANELFLSVHTVKMHIRNLYPKLGVHRRTDAVARARALGLLGPPLPRR